jgi:hypothetical protein
VIAAIATQGSNLHFDEIASSAKRTLKVIRSHPRPAIIHGNPSAVMSGGFTLQAMAAKAEAPKLQRNIGLYEHDMSLTV